MDKVICVSLVLLTLGAHSANAVEGQWTPDTTLVAQIEKTFSPTMSDGMLTDIGGHSVVAPAPLDQYTRYYVGETDKGERVVIGSFIRGFGDAPGIHIVTDGVVPGGSGGGCNIIHVWYHVASKKLESVCNFPM